MNAGMGVIHSERPPDDIHEIGGRQEIIQLWVNTPAEHKMDQPAYYPVSAEEVPTYKTEDGKASVSVFAGSVLGLKGPVPSFTEVNAATAVLSKGGKISIPLPEHHSVMVYLLDGRINVEGFGLVEGLHLVHFKKDGEVVSLEGLEDTRLLLLSGAPLDEEVVSYGPFVMNTQTEIMEAMRDYQKGKMGILIEE